MSQLGAKDLEAALQFALHAQATDELHSFRHHLVPGLRQLVACDSLGYNEIDLDRRTAFVLSDAPVFEGISERFLALAHQHPMVPYQRRGDLRTRLMSDFLSVRAFHRLELYQDIYRPLGIEDQLALGIGRDGIVAINLARGRRTFTERDRQLMELVRPHLAAAWHRGRERERLNVLIEALDSGLAERDAAVIQLDTGGRIARATGPVRELLAAYFVALPRDGDQLPPNLSPGDDSMPQLALTGPRGSLRIREHRSRGGWRTLVLSEQRARPPDIDSLRSLGLTHRQAQVLRLLICGKPSRQIGLELGISTSTVSKHLEHIYERLGVRTRAQAIAHVH